MRQYTRFAYQNSKVLKAYTIQTIYSLDTFEAGAQVTLANIDGSIQSYINLDNLVFTKDAYDFNILQDALSFYKTDATTVKVYYNNIDEDNQETNITITRLDTAAVLYSSTSFLDPNEITIYYSWATETNITNTTLFKIQVITLDDDGNTGTISKYFNVNAQSGILNSWFALIGAVLLIIFGFSLTSASTSFSWFGIILSVAALGILSLSAGAWYVTFMMGVAIILLVYTVLVMLTKNQQTLS